MNYLHLNVVVERRSDIRFRVSKAREHLTRYQVSTPRNLPSRQPSRPQTPPGHEVFNSRVLRSFPPLPVFTTCSPLNFEVPVSRHGASREH